MSDLHASPAAVDDEPKSPPWLPALGAALFASVALTWTVMPSPPLPVADEAAESASAAAPSASAATTVAAPAPAPSPPPAAIASARPQPSASALPPSPPPTLRERVKGMKDRLGGRGNP